MKVVFDTNIWLYYVQRREELQEIVEQYKSLLQRIRGQLPNVEVVLTVSPIRHLRDGFVENQVSKSTLLIAVASISKSMDFVHYFPAYELMMDDLRDYRFYEKDMIHPSGVAIDYIWTYFSTSFFSELTQKMIFDISKIQDAVQHRTSHWQLPMNLDGVVRDGGMPYI